MAKNSFPAAVSMNNASVNRFMKALPWLMYLGYTVLVLLTVNNGFFWDSILLASRYGQWYYATDLKTIFVPQEIAGYPPLFGMFMALSWKFLGKTVAVSHLVMLPFVLGIVYQVLRLCRKFFAAKPAIFAAILLLADPTLLAQSAQVAPDVLLVFLYLFCLNKLLENNRWVYMLALVLLGMLSPRGTIAVSLLFVTDVLLCIFAKKSDRPIPLSLLFSYVPAGLLVLLWQYLHYQHFGWIGYNPQSSWGEYSKFAGFSGMARNLAIIAWRMLDFGRVALWLVFIFSAVSFFRRNPKLPAELSRLFTLFVVPFFGFSLVFLPFNNPIGHRYYLVPFLLFALLVYYLLLQLQSRKLRRILYTFMLLSLASGHFWVYPEGIAKGWDASLAHLPYFELRKEALQYLDKNHIPREQVGSDYPNLSPESQTDLTTDNRRLKSKDLATDQFVLYSNVFNSFTDEEIAALKTNWQPVESWKRGQVFLFLYRRPQ